MDITKICAKKIKNLRELNDFTQGYVADILEISQNAYSLLEKGTTKITLDRLAALAELYKTTPEELIKDGFAVESFQAAEGKGQGIIHSNFPPALSPLEKQMYEQTINRLEDNIEKLYDLIAQLTKKIADPHPQPTQNKPNMQIGKANW